jgi:hypothetical protein
METKRPFQADDYTTFEYIGYDFTDNYTKLALKYRLVGDEPVEFTEVIQLQASEHVLEESEQQALEKTARLLLLAAGVSYYKAAAPEQVKIPFDVSSQERQFVVDIIGKGMTEFAYVNNDFRALHPIVTSTKQTKAQPVTLPEQGSKEPLVPIGGGKDSTVTFEALRSAGFHPTLFSVNTFPATTQTVEIAKLPYVKATRKISPALIDVNEQGAKNGHIPVTVIVTLIAILAALREGLRTVVFSNERSASSGNVLWQGIEVNHQWSKSLESEKLVADIVHAVVSPDITYFSLLRPFSELRITRQFATLEQYHLAFTSCNRAFLFVEENRAKSWCGNCPKCRFVFLMLAPYVSRQEVERIWGHNLLEDDEQMPGFREILGIEGHKPLDCVGEVEESRVALLLLAKKSEWQSVDNLQQLLDELPDSARPTKQQTDDVFAISSDHYVPQTYQGALDAIK